MLQLIVYSLLIFLTLLAVFDVIRLCKYDNEVSKRRMRMWSDNLSVPLDLFTPCHLLFPAFSIPAVAILTRLTNTLKRVSRNIFGILTTYEMKSFSRRVRLTPFEVVKNTLKGMRTLKEEAPPPAAAKEAKPYSISETV